jgi:anti-sigma regulatory factor (Ser/Thr protein kinase)/ActR/RegA family two-component response regulator
MIAQNAILISENPQISAVCAAVLKPRGWVIRNVVDNAAALNLVKRTRCDLVITSEHTSGQQDVDLLCAIRHVRPHTRVIIFTDQTTPLHVISAIREHAFAYFSTPFSMTSLTSIIQCAMEEPCWDDGIDLVSATSGWICIRVRCDMKVVERLMQFFHEIISLPADEKEVVALAIRELLMNAFEHGCKLDPKQYAEVSYLRTARAVACKIKDPGKGFSPGDIPHSALQNPPDDPLRHLEFRDAASMRPGGFGMLLVKNSIDELFYNEQGNEVVMIKHVDPTVSADHSTESVSILPGRTSKGSAGTTLRATGGLTAGAIVADGF